MMILALFSHAKTLALLSLIIALVCGGFFLIQKVKAAWTYDATPPTIDSMSFSAGNGNQITFNISGSDNISFPAPSTPPTQDTQVTIEVVATNNTSSTPSSASDITSVYTSCPDVFPFLPTAGTTHCYKQNTANRATQTTTGNRTVIVPINEASTNLSFFARIKQDEAGNTGNWILSNGGAAPVVTLKVRAGNDSAFQGPGGTPTTDATNTESIWLAWTILNGATSCSATSLNTRPPGGSVATWNGAVPFNPANLKNIGAISGSSSYTFSVQCFNGATPSNLSTVTVYVTKPANIQTQEGDVHTNEDINQQQ